MTKIFLAIYIVIIITIISNNVCEKGHLISTYKIYREGRVDLTGLILDEEIENNVETGEKNFYRTIVDNIRTIRLQRGISIETLAINTGVDKSHLYRVEKGSKKIGLDALRRIAVVLEVPLSRLLVNTTTIEEKEEIREIDLILHSLDYNEIIYFQRMMKAYYKEKVNETFTKRKK